MNFPLDKFNPFEIGLRPIDKKGWLSLNSFDSIYIQNKHRLIQENIQDVYFVSEDYKQDIFDLAQLLQSDLIEQESGLQERLHLSLRETGIKSINHDNALLVLSLLVEDDLVILRPEEDSFKMIAGAVFSPSGWDLKSKQFLDINNIHSPVPHYDSLLAERLNKILTKLPIGIPFERHNWSIYGSEDLFQPSQIKQAKGIDIGSKEDIESISIRIERQTLYKPENSNLILFSIKVRNYQIKEITDNKSLVQNFYSALIGLSEEMIEYKGLTSSIGLFKDYLKSFL
ncbi:MAG: heme-dependent oxidative N-demethylase subunit alpha family protein [Gammaproteobacteria bacterium]